MERASAILVNDTSSVVDLEAPKRKPKRVIHFSDGTLEEYSDDDELHDPAEEAENLTKTSNQALKSTNAVAEKKSPRHMRWGEYLLHMTMTFGTRSLNFCDYLGEKFAWALGITTPKYGYAIEEREWQQKEEKAEREREDRERAARAKRNAVGPRVEIVGGGVGGFGDCNANGVSMVSEGLNLHAEKDILESENQKY